MRWEELVKLENLCGGAPLASLVFCCGEEKRCPIRATALKMLEIEPERYVEVKEKYRIDAEETCFGNLAYCCSLNRSCDARDSALRRIGMSPAEYLQYKFKILKELIPKEKLNLAFEKRVMHKFAFELVSINNTDVGYRGLALGNPDFMNSLLILSCEPIRPNISDDVKNEVKKSEFISFRVTKEQYEKIADIASKGGCNMSDVIRDALDLYLSLHQFRDVQKKADT